MELFEHGRGLHTQDLLALLGETCVSVREDREFNHKLVLLVEAVAASKAVTNADLDCLCSSISFQALLPYSLRRLADNEDIPWNIVSKNLICYTEGLMKTVEKLNQQVQLDSKDTKLPLHSKDAVEAELRNSEDSKGLFYLKQLNMDVTVPRCSLELCFSSDRLVFFGFQWQAHCVVAAKGVTFTSNLEDLDRFSRGSRRFCVKVKVSDIQSRPDWRIKAAVFLSIHSYACAEVGRHTVSEKSFTHIFTSEDPEIRAPGDLRPFQAPTSLDNLPSGCNYSSTFGKYIKRDCQHFSVGVSIMPIQINGQLLPAATG